MIPVIDMHCDTIAEIYAAEERGDRSLGLRKNGLMMDLERMKEGGYMCQSFALFSHMGRLREAGKDPFDHVCALSRTFDEQMAANSDLISPVTTGSQIEDNMHKGLMSALKTVEEGAVYEGSIEKLECLYDMGVRKSTLTWNFENELAYPNRSVHDPRKGTTTCSRVGIEGRMSVPVIGCPLFRVRKHGIRLSCLLKFLLRSLVAGIGIGMVFFSQLPVCFFYGRVVGIFVDAEDLIIISLFCHVLRSCLPDIPLAGISSPPVCLN